MIRSTLISFFVGVTFAIGLAISGMTMPSKVIGFLDILGNWEPALIFVMASAVTVYFIGFRFVQKLSQPIFTTRFSIPTRTIIDKPLLIGGALFGVGWGIGGLCPGPAIVSLATGRSHVIWFVVSMGIGGWLVNKIQHHLPK